MVPRLGTGGKNLLAEVQPRRQLFYREPIITAVLLPFSIERHCSRRRLSLGKWDLGTDISLPAQCSRYIVWYCNTNNYNKNKIKKKWKSLRIHCSWYGQTCHLPSGKWQVWPNVLLFCFGQMYCLCHQSFIYKKSNKNEDFLLCEILNPRFNDFALRKK